MCDGDGASEGAGTATRVVSVRRRAGVAAWGSKQSRRAVKRGSRVSGSSTITRRQLRIMWRRPRAKMRSTRRTRHIAPPFRSAFRGPNPLAGRREGAVAARRGREYTALPDNEVARHAHSREALQPSRGGRRSRPRGLRFRSNIVIDGVRNGRAGLVRGRIRIGKLELDWSGKKKRALRPANTANGDRRPLMIDAVTAFAAERPT